MQSPKSTAEIPFFIWSTGLASSDDTTIAIKSEPFITEDESTYDEIFFNNSFLNSVVVNVSSLSIHLVFSLFTFGLF